MLTKTNWTKQNKTTVQSSHPHLLSSETILITLNKQVVTASPFKLPKNEEERKIVEQNNYTNNCLNIISDQLDKIEIKLDTIDIKKTIPIPNKEKPLIKLHEIRQGLGLKSNKTKTREKIEQILQELHLSIFINLHYYTALKLLFSLILLSIVLPLMVSKPSRCC